MVITETHFKLINKYAKKLATTDQEIDDIVQESCVLLLISPPETITKALLFKVVKRGKFYHKYRYSFNKTKLNMLQTGPEADKAIETAQDESINLNDSIYFKQMHNQFHNLLNKKIMKKYSISTMQQDYKMKGEIDLFTPNEKKLLKLLMVSDLAHGDYVSLAKELNWTRQYLKQAQNTLFRKIRENC